LAGRIAYEELSGLHLTEIQSKHATDELWFRGGFPQSLRSSTERASMRWLKDFLFTITARDLPLLGLNTDFEKLRLFVSMLAQQHGGLMNRETLSRSVAVSSTTIARYLYYLENVYLIRELQPWYINAKKRLVKSPKVYIRDSGVLHSILGIDASDILKSHISVGASWEGFVIEQTASILPDGFQMYFYRTHQGAEADLVLVKNGKPVVTAEIKRSMAPMMSKGFANVIEDINTRQNYIIYPGTDSFPVDQHVQAIGLQYWLELVRRF